MKTGGRCACCGKTRCTAWGFVYREGGPRACYFIEWTVGRADCAARIDVVVGDWFDGTTELDRDALSIEYRLLDAGPTFTVVDAAGRPAAEVGRPAKASEVSGSPLAEEALTIARAVLEKDERVAELMRARVATSLATQ